jgi:hypothetical protein
MSYNILSVLSIEPKEYPLILTAAAADFMAALAATQSFQAETISLANVDAAVAYDVTIQLLRGATAYILLPAITIQPKQCLALPFLHKLETGDKFQGFGSTTLKIHAAIGGKLFT